MSIFGIGTETFLLINGLKTTQSILLSKDVELLPVNGDFPYTEALGCMKNDMDFGVAALFGHSIYSQLRISAANAKELAIRAWNAQWDVVLLSAVFRCFASCNLQSTNCVEEISRNSVLEVTNYHFRGLVSTPYVISQDDIRWLLLHYAKAENLLDQSESFKTAVHSLHSFHWHTHPRVQLAILWAGIEALFDITSELRFRVSLLVSKFLSETDEDAKQLFSKVKSLYDSRSKAVHGAKSKSDYQQTVEESASLLQHIIIKCIEMESLPDVDMILFS